MRQKIDIINMYFVNAPFFLRWCYPEVVFNKSRTEKKVYLTFDDGPIPEITPFVLDTLAYYDVKATFFCVGDNIRKNPSIFERILADGHQVGNHTYHHLRGWDTGDATYLKDIQACQELTKTDLFRPPYARAKKSQLKEISKHYRIIFWDVLSGDFDLNLTPEKCFRNVVRYSRNGSIIVFHDNVKAMPRLSYALPRAIAYLQERGYTFSLL
ncbi:peptidoglycan/xylan/chitin deacetylase (PgdA/CDA1 family) [Sphingobacterium allocomposti]|uniref:Peptidoglycan/xylan/chitin deacetylase (PgdA/CDA1 family) n=1 Tax=Sphingobacterium allocomposti TaxID=415956 RepID=A0A5S5DPU9_9SPHI|nr:polysaccharide deacetylase family protein [Sphingobacterium composti Yoo et al. 2007 non Ten et al. 2007]TYP97704.1 peptidoglycan/xylan/chitin deacetylase (PgdA/CDA1 family) [Sphingobacterium composti Yoo et al. 2007 non Ten et al. 2007]HLS96273.1 polysaccharide deacetylase family protein [Sphingobacterium sp.]